MRFIAINNGVDSASQTESDFTPFLNIMNEFYAKDTSKKIRAVFKAKGQAGKPLCTNPPYGYLKDPADHHRLSSSFNSIPRRFSLRESFEIGTYSLKCYRINPGTFQWAS